MKHFIESAINVMDMENYGKPKQKTPVQVDRPKQPPGAVPAMDLPDYGKKKQGSKQKRNKEKTRGRKGLNRSPFGDSLMRELDKMMQG